jgi:hypothetical protein
MKTKRTQDKPQVVRGGQMAPRRPDEFSQAVPEPGDSVPGAWNAPVV